MSGLNYVLIVSLDDDHDEFVKKLLLNLEEDQTLKSYKLSDIQHEYSDLIKYSDKLDRMLQNLNRMFLVNSDNLHLYIENGTTDNKFLKMPGVKEILDRFIRSEGCLTKAKSKIVLLSPVHLNSPPDYLKDLEYIDEIFDEERNIVSSKIQLILTRCRFYRQPEEVVNNKTNKKKKGCQLM
nr:uncharacterized protein LOC124811485 [Hydra vulgaris]XP_047133121.1 uncharacterized protein LOC124811485 [Hydra vulgaris]XP_047133122.1 uncharacterized protein LOC124811485 [Hydra vulgaris]